MLRLTVTPSGGDTFEVVVPGKALLDWEAEHHEPLQKSINSGLSACAYQVAHAALQQRAGETRPYEEWLETIDDITMQPTDPEFYFRAVTIGLSADQVESYSDILTDIAKAKRAGIDPTVTADPTGGESAHSEVESPA